MQIGKILMVRLLSTSTEQTSAQRESVGHVSPAFQRECVEFFADFVQVLGVQRSIGQIYGLLFSSPYPLSFTEIAERLDISKGSASQGLQALRLLGAVHSVSSAADRRERFIPELALRRLVRGVLREKIEPVVSDGGIRVKKLSNEALKAPDAGGRRFSEGRVKQIETWRRQMTRLLPLLKTIVGSGRD